MRNRPSLLFSNYDLGETIRNAEANLHRTVEAMSKDQFMATPEADLIEHFVADKRMEPLVLHEDAATMKQEETQIDVTGDSRGYFSGSGPHYIPGTKVTVTIPYTGDLQLWTCRPSTYQTSYPHGQAEPRYYQQPGQLKLEYAIPHDTESSAIQVSHQRNMDQIRFYLGHVNNDIEQFNAGLSRRYEDAIRDRKQRLEKHEGLSQMLGIPLENDPNAPSVKPIQVERNLVKPLPTPPSSGYQPEPGIVEETYEFILDVIRHEGRTFEDAPGTFGKMGEEELRDVVLAHLNGHYKGDATGETFRKKGKTDIRVEEENRAAFVAECKLWGGPKILSDAIDQLTGYLTWRDCKAAMVIFNTKVSGFTGILEKVPDVLTAHPLFKRMESASREGEWRAVFQAEGDELREIRIHVFMFDLYLAS